jgi:hypothetical protein
MDNNLQNLPNWFMKISAINAFTFLSLAAVLIFSCADSEAANNQLTER